MQCADDVLWNGTPETCIILLASVTAINSIKNNLKEKLDVGGTELNSLSWNFIIIFLIMGTKQSSQKLKRSLTQ